MTSRSGTSNFLGSVARAMKLAISHVRFACGGERVLNQVWSRHNTNAEGGCRHGVLGVG